MGDAERKYDAFYARVSGTSSMQLLELLLRDISHSFSRSEITESEYDTLCRRIDAARIRSKTATAAAGNTATSRAIPRRHRVRSPDYEKSRMRRRAIASRNMMPDRIACQFTEGERAVLNVIALACQLDVFKVCGKSIDEIAALAGVCRTTVQNALHEARRLGVIRVTYRPQRGAKSMTNLVEITSKEWKAWLSLRLKTKAIGSNFFVPDAPVLVSTTYDQSQKGSDTG